MKIEFPYVYVRALKLEGTWPNDVGCWGRTVQRIMYGEGIPLKFGYVDFDASVPGPLPDLPDADPSSFLVGGPFLLIRSLDDAIRLPHHLFGESLSVGCYMNHSWHTNRGTGELTEPMDGERLGSDTHGLQLTSMNKTQQQFGFVNTWGPEWGDMGRGRMPFSYFDKYVFEAYASLMPNEDQFVTSSDTKLGSIRISSFDTRVGPCFYFATLIRDGKRIGWAFAKDTNQHFDIYEVFVWPKHRGEGAATAMIDSLSATLLLRPGQRRRLLIPYSDSKLHSPSSFAAIEKIAKRIGVRFSPPDSKFDCYFATEEGKSLIPLGRNSIPTRPKSTMQALADSFDVEDEIVNSDETTELQQLEEINPRRLVLARRLNKGVASEEEKAEFEELQRIAMSILSRHSPSNFDVSDLPDLEERLRRTND